MRYAASSLVALLALAATAAGLLRVGIINETEPFVIEIGDNHDSVEGFDIDLLDEVIKLSPYKDDELQFYHFHTLTEMLTALRNNGTHEQSGVQIDVGVSAVVSSDDDDRFIDFSTPYFTAGLQILVKNKVERSSVIAAFMNAPLIQFIFCIFIIFLVLFAHCIWICERWSNKDFRPDYLEGVSDGFWWAAVTTGTVGYGDKTPKSPLGKTLTIMLMFWSMIMTSLLIAGVTSVLSATIFITGPASASALTGLRVGIVRGRASVSWCKANLAAELLVYDRLSDAVADLLANENNAVIDDTSRLIHHAASHPELRVSGELFDPHRYAFAFPQGSPMNAIFSHALHKIETAGTLNTLYRKWISALDREFERESRATVDPTWVSFVFSLAMVIVCTSILICITQFVKRAFVDRKVELKIPSRDGAMVLMRDMLNAGLSRPAASLDGLFNLSTNPDAPLAIAGSSVGWADARSPRGQSLDSFWNPEDGVPLANVPHDSEVAMLRQMVTELQVQVELLKMGVSPPSSDVAARFPVAHRVNLGKHMEVVDNIGVDKK